MGDFMKDLLDKIIENNRIFIDDGDVATYIPELAHMDKYKFAISVSDSSGIVSSGDFDTGFTMQSIVKPLILLLALMDNGEDEVRRIVGVEATGKPFDAFNYSDQALKKENINPMINAGAIALCTLIKGEDKDEKIERLLDLAKKMSGNDTIRVDTSVYESEKRTGYKNRALAYMLKAYGMIEADIEETLDVYFSACSFRVTAENLSEIAYTLAMRGVNRAGVRVFERRFSHYVNAIIATSGMYDGSGQFAIDVGIPAKSGVGGGIMAIVPGKMGIAIFSPSLDKKGNSIAGVKAVAELSRELNLSIY